MIDRYTPPEMKELWSETQQFQAWLDVELAACAAWAEVGVIPQEDVETLYREARFDLDRIHEIEQQTLRFEGVLSMPQGALSFVAFKKKPDYCKVVLFGGNGARIV
ncbi:MAG: hypothetical protein ACE10K_14225, partial [Rhodothermales bacterium]